MPEDETLKSKVKESQLNFNSLIGIIALAVIGWVGTKTLSNSDTLIKIEATLPTIVDSAKEVKGQISTLVTRSEMESRFNEMAAKNEVLNSRLLKLEYEKRKPDQ